MTTATNLQEIWVQTGSGQRIYPFALDKNTYHIEDIANALSKLCRYNGHCDRFYSVAEHCVRAARYAPPYLKLHMLLHDAAEAYLGDIPRPIKKAAPQITAIEDKMLTDILTKFGLEPVLSDEVWALDDQMLVTEVSIMCPEVNITEWGFGHVPRLDPTLSASGNGWGWQPRYAKMAFIAAFRQYMEGNYEFAA